MNDTTGSILNAFYQIGKTRGFYHGYTHGLICGAGCTLIGFAIGKYISKKIMDDISYKITEEC